jgi:hypothetical protein
MRFTAYRWMISTVLSRERGLKRRPLSLHPIPGFSKKGEPHQQKTIVFASPNFRLISHPILYIPVVPAGRIARPSQSCSRFWYSMGTSSSGTCLVLTPPASASGAFSTPLIIPASKDCPSSSNSSTLSESARGRFDSPWVSPDCPAVSGPVISLSIFLIVTPPRYAASRGPTLTLQCPKHAWR